MADIGPPSGDDTGSKDRTTVALVGAEIREVKAIITGHAELTAERLNAIRETILPLKDIPLRVTKLEARVDHLEESESDREDRFDRLRDWRRAAATTAVVATAGLLVNLALTFHWFS